ncbi:hypothetical protein MUK42_04305 [Musa troglodytarum]|uniref:Uncharacterized protein n=1 Tax=Musa troglodytarum TaxID=320322 RepID=A0A9E7GH87_9LILI|nr:hypothetical protein MUK42_04305 [Musa troglodytarum]
MVLASGRRLMIQNPYGRVASIRRFSSASPRVHAELTTPPAYEARSVHHPQTQMGAGHSPDIFKARGKVRRRGKEREKGAHSKPLNWYSLGGREKTVGNHERDADLSVGGVGRSTLRPAFVQVPPRDAADSPSRDADGPNPTEMTPNH